jgi:Phosphotransferase enzyme family
MISGEGWISVSNETACAVLREAGLDVSPAQVRVEAREDCWLAWLPGERLAWFPADAKGRESLKRERRILRLLAERCAFLVPRVLFESEQGWDVRAGVPGVCDPWDLYRRTLTDVPLAPRLGAAIGLILVEQHTRIARADVAGWLPGRPAWPEPSDRIRRSLPEVIDDRALLADIDRALDAYDGVTVAADDHVLVHGDLGLHNIAVDPATSDVRGVFDYEDASWADRHHDFRYLIFHHERDDALEAALAVYEPALGRTLSRDRIRLYNAACAIGFLAFRRGVPPDQRSCGRTLGEDLQWVRGAIAAQFDRLDRKIAPLGKLRGDQSARERYVQLGHKSFCDDKRQGGGIGHFI